MKQPAALCASFTNDCCPTITHVDGPNCWPITFIDGWPA